MKESQPFSQVCLTGDLLFVAKVGLIVALRTLVNLVRIKRMWEAAGITQLKFVYLSLGFDLTERLCFLSMINFILLMK